MYLFFGKQRKDTNAQKKIRHGISIFSLGSKKKIQKKTIRALMVAIFIFSLLPKEKIQIAKKDTTCYLSLFFGKKGDKKGYKKKINALMVARFVSLLVSLLRKERLKG